jgi:hypothetical protein
LTPEAHELIQALYATLVMKEATTENGWRLPWVGGSALEVLYMCEKVISWFTYTSMGSSQGLSFLNARNGAVVSPLCALLKTRLSAADAEYIPRLRRRHTTPEQREQNVHKELNFLMVQLRALSGKVDPRIMVINEDEEEEEVAPAAPPSAAYVDTVRQRIEQVLMTTFSVVPPRNHFAWTPPQAAFVQAAFQTWLMHLAPHAPRRRTLDWDERSRPLGPHPLTPPPLAGSAWELCFILKDCMTLMRDSFAHSRVRLFDIRMGDVYLEAPINTWLKRYLPGDYHREDCFFVEEMSNAVIRSTAPLPLTMRMREGMELAAAQVMHANLGATGADVREMVLPFSWSRPLLLP